MRIFDKNNNELESKDCDLNLGRLESESVLKAHHPAVEYSPAIEEKWHFEVAHEYANGGKDLVKIVDSPGVPEIEAADAWDEYEEIWRYVPYTEEKLEEIRNRISVEELINVILGINE